MNAEPPTDNVSPADGVITVYQRPGCPYCFMLLRGLRKAGVGFYEVDIWEDPDAAAVVRSLAGGNETVPTVVVGGVARVNPRADEVVDLARSHAPSALPPDDDGPPASGWRDRIRRARPGSR